MGKQIRDSHKLSPYPNCEEPAMPNQSLPATRVSTSHPLDPLNEIEIAAAVTVVKKYGKLSPRAWFESIYLHEPEKSLVRNFQAGYQYERRAYVCCYDPASNQTVRGIVCITTEQLESWDVVTDGGQARIVADEYFAASLMATKDPALIAACAKRGITDMNRVLVEPWAAGYFGIKEEEGKRMAYGQCWYSDDSGDNPYARPLAGLHPVIDLQNMTVIRIDDFGVAPIPPNTGTLKPDKMRTDIKPLHITQPEGPSFIVEGHLVKWQKWHIRVGFNVREGLTLHDIKYEDKGRLRPIIYRASMPEMVVPYGHPGNGHFRRNAFDNGEYGVGQLFDSLSLGCDCVGDIKYFDADFHDWLGTPKKIKNAICMHEEDYGLLWKFTNGYQPHLPTYRARSRRLVISGLSTIGNYVYGFFWYFYQDGTIGVEIKATGIPFPSGLYQQHSDGYGETIAPFIDLHTHQHCFSFRFDMAIDGDKNAIREMNFVGEKISQTNPHGNAIRAVETPLTHEQQAQRNIDLAAARYWRVVNPNSKNAMGKPVGYKLATGVNALPFLDPAAPVAKRAQFMFKHFWATQYRPDEIFPAGMFPNQHAGGDGLPKWTAADRHLENENVVVWYTLNLHHLARLEDWPIQPVLYANFHWMADGFFDQNPAMDVPPPHKANHCQ